MYFMFRHTETLYDYTYADPSNVHPHVQITRVEERRSLILRKRIIRMRVTKM